MSKLQKWLLIGVAGFFVLVLLVTIFRPAPADSDQRSISTLLADAKSGSIQKIEVKGSTLR